MKLFQIFFFAILLTAFTACGDDEAAPDGSIVGDWDVTAIDYGGTSTTSGPGFPTITSTFTGTGVDMNLMVSFSEDPNVYTSSGSYGVELTTETQGQSSTDTVTISGFADDGEWSQNGSTIMVTASNGETSEITIISIDGDEMILEFGDVTTTQSGDFTSTSEVMGTYTFQRQ